MTVSEKITEITEEQMQFMLMGAIIFSAGISNKFPEKDLDTFEEMYLVGGLPVVADNVFKKDKDKLDILQATAKLYLSELEFEK